MAINLRAKPDSRALALWTPKQGDRSRFVGGVSLYPGGGARAQLFSRLCATWAPSASQRLKMGFNRLQPEGTKARLSGPQAYADERGQGRRNTW